jgi:taurine dioxygenase
MQAGGSEIAFAREPLPATTITDLLQAARGRRRTARDERLQHDNEIDLDFHYSRGSESTDQETRAVTNLTASAYPFSITPLTVTLGAQIEGLDLSQPLDAETREAVHRALLRYKVLFFNDQHIDRESHRRFAGYFGPLETHPVYGNIEGYPELITIRETYHPELVRSYRTLDKWHSDVTFNEIPPFGSVLRANRLPATGGDTIWADTAAIYEFLPDDVKARIEGLTALHDAAKSFQYYLDDEKLADLRARKPPIEHPVVRIHPETGERHLFVNATFTTRIVGLPPEESDRLLSFLFDRVKVPEHQVRLRWAPGTIAFWDNRATQHYAVNDYGQVDREMERATISGSERPVGPRVAQAA